MITHEPAIVLEGATKAFGSHIAVSDLDLEVPRGAVYGLLGPNGSGKTTTIRMIMGILHPDTGSVRLFDGRPDAHRRARVGYLPEERGVYRKMRVLDLLVFLAEIRGLNRSEGRRRASDWLERLELTAWSDRRVEDLSKGMQQKVQFVGTVIHEPDLLILDEPFSGLDPINQDVLEAIVRDLNKKGITILLSTHLMDQAERLCQRVCLISRSRKVLDDDLRQLKARERRGVIAVEFTGSEGWLEHPEIRSVERVEGVLHVVLRDPGAHQSVLRHAVQSGVEILRFDLVEPRLHEIFVRHVAHNGDAGEVSS
jgi:ABC-2 type transport system ATP-binding protein